MWLVRVLAKVAINGAEMQESAWGMEAWCADDMG
jgi:hypothetical protein